MVSDFELRRQIRRVVGLDIFKATLGDADGRVDAPGLPGYVVIRYVQAGGAFSQPVTVRFRAVMKKKPGAAVVVSFDDDGELAVLRPDFVGETSAGTQPQGDNPADDNVSYFIQQQRLLTFVCHPVSSAADSMLLAVQTGTVVDLSTDTFTLFYGSQEDLTSYIPAGAGEWCLACLFWKDDNTIEIFASTPKTNPDDLGIDDINECMAARTEGSLPIWAWRLYNGQTGIASGAPADGGDDFMDLRPLWFMLQAGGTGMTDFDVAADTGTPATITDGDTLTIAGGTGIDTVVSGNTVTITNTVTDTGITQLTGDVTAGPGSGSQAATLATVNSNVGSFTNADITVNAKGLITAAANGSAGSSPWATDSNVVNLNTDTDTVTIGSNTAGGKLFIDGDADEVQLQIQAHTTQTALPFVLESSAGADQITFTGTGGAVFNEAGNDADFRVEGDTDTNLIHVDASTDRVGIGTATPAAKLDVRGSASFNLDNGNNDFIVDGQNDNNVFVVDASQDAVGIGTATPAASAVLQLVSITKGFLPPKMTSGQRDAISATAGLIVFSTDLDKINVRQGSAWQEFTTNAESQTLTNKTLTTPTIADFTNAQHDHLDADDGGTLSASAIASGTLPLARLPALTARQFSQTNTVTVNTTTAETTILGTGVGTLTLAANQLVAGSAIKITVSGYGQRSSGNLTARIRLGGTLIIATATAGPAFSANHMFKIEAMLTCITTGASGTVFGQGSLLVGGTTVLAAQLQMVSTAAVTVDTTGTLAIDATIQWSSSSGTNTVTTTNALIEVSG